MIKGIDVNQRIEFLSKFDNSEPKTVFVLRPLSGFEMMEFSEGRKEDIYNMILKSVVEVKNFEDNNIEKAINSLGIRVIGELIQFINEINNITEQDAKN